MKQTKPINPGLKSGDYDSYKALFEKCYGKLLSFVIRLVNDKQAAEDIVQEQFMKLWDKKQTINEYMSVESYLYVMTKNAAINYLKSHGKLDNLPESGPSIAINLDLDRSIDEATIRAKLQELIDTMPAQRKKIFIMSKIDGMSNIEIAKITGLSVKTVDRHLALAKSFLKNTISQHMS